jgi:hypothetical protein
MRLTPSQCNSIHARHAHRVRSEQHTMFSPGMPGMPSRIHMPAVTDAGYGKFRALHTVCRTERLNLSSASMLLVPVVGDLHPCHWHPMMMGHQVTHGLSQRNGCRKLQRLQKVSHQHHWCLVSMQVNTVHVC